MWLVGMMFRVSVPRAAPRGWPASSMGMPVFSPELEQDLDEGRAVLGGCVVFEG
jgi:hypothetical protein